MDIILAVCLGVIQFLLALMGVIVSVRPPKSERHKYWIGGFILVGLIGVGMTGGLSYRASREQTSINQEMRSVVAEATGANTAATQANNSVLTYQTELNKAQEEERKAKDDLKNLITKTSAEASKEITELGAQTQATIKSLSLRAPARRIPSAERAKIIRFLAQKHSIVQISCIANNKEAWRFAQDWDEVLSAAGWKVVGNGISSFMSFGPPTQGLVIKFHGSPVAPGHTVRVPKSSPQGMIGMVADALKVNVTVQRLPSIKEGRVDLEIYGNSAGQ